MEGVDHVHVVEVGRRRLVGEIHRVLEGEVPDGERLVLGIARADAALILMVELAQAGRHLAAAGAGGGDDDDGAARLDKVVLTEPVVGDDVRDVRGVARDGVVAVTLHAERRQAVDERVGGRLPGVLRDDDRADIKAEPAEHVDQAQHVVIIADAEVAAHFVLLDIPRADGHHDLHVVFHRGEHADLAVGLEPRQHARGVVVVKELAAELQIELAAELAHALPDVLCLQLQIFIIVETDLHDCFPPLVQNLKNITGCIIYQIGPAGKRFRPFWGRKIR